MQDKNGTNRETHHLRNRINRTLDMRRRQHRKDTRIHNPQIPHPMNPKLFIDNTTTLILPHSTSSRRMIKRRHTTADISLYICVGHDIGAGGLFDRVG